MAGSLRLTREQLAIITGGDPRAIKAFEDFFATMNALGTHAATHEPGGADPLAVDAAAATGSLRTLGVGAAQAAAGSHNHKLDDLLAPDDNTDLNATAAAHGLLPKLSGVATDALLGNGTWNTPGVLPTLHAQDQKAANTSGGDFNSGAWRTRVLNTVVTNTIAGASLASNQITLPAGTYEIDALAPAFQVSRHKAALYDTTGAAYLLYGTSEATASVGTDASTLSYVRGRFTIAVQSVLELRHQCEITKATYGLGVESNFGVIEIYAEVVIRKVG